MRRAALLAGLAALLAGAPAGAAADAAQGEAFLAGNAKAAGVHVTASGLEYRILASGPADGVSPTLASTVRVNYQVALLDGRIVDSSFQRGAPDDMALGRLIPAWREAIPMMRPGDTWEVWSPPSLAYGNKPTGPIPPGSVLDFRIQLIAVDP